MLVTAMQIRMPTDEDLIATMRAMLDPQWLAGAVDLARVEAAEAALGVSFPRSYRLFLLNFGAGRCGEHEVFGIDPSPDEVDGSSLFIDVVQMNRPFRSASFDPRRPAYLLNISGDDGDLEFFLDTSASDAEGECPVVAIGPSGTVCAVAESFVAFLSASRAASL